MVSLHELVVVADMPTRVPLAAAHDIRKRLNVFDAFDVAFADHDTVISSDRVFESNRPREDPD